MNKILKILIIPIIIILTIIIYTLYMINNNKNYIANLNQNIKNNYQINGEITYSNEYNNYYIFTTNTRVIVLNNEYIEILNEDINSIKTINSNQNLIYKTNKLMFEETKITDNKLIYKYYDANTGIFIKETILERK